MLRLSDGSSEVGSDVRAALDQGGSRGTSLHGQAREVVGRLPLVPRKDAWDLAPLAASSRGGLASCGGMRREPDVRQELVERAGTLMRDFAAMDEVRSFARFGVIDRSVERSPCARRSDRPTHLRSMLVARRYPVHLSPRTRERVRP